MEAHVIHMCKEREALVENIAKLLAFIKSDRFDNLSKRQQKLLCRQHVIMETYSEILEERIALG